MMLWDRNVNYYWLSIKKYTVVHKLLSFLAYMIKGKVLKLLCLHLIFQMFSLVDFEHNGEQFSLFASWKSSTGTRQEFYGQTNMPYKAPEFWGNMNLWWVVKLSKLLFLNYKFQMFLLLNTRMGTILGLVLHFETHVLFLSQELYEWCRLQRIILVRVIFSLLKSSISFLVLVQF